MEKRNVQLTGNSTYTVSIPKEWADANEVNSESVLHVVASGDRLVLSADTDERVQRELDIDLFSTEEVHGALVGMYENGVDEIALVADPIETDQRRTIQETTKGLFGAELLEATGSRIVVESVIEPGSLTLESGLIRIQSLVLTMLKEALNGLASDDTDLVRGIVERDEEVDRLWSFMSRQVRTTLRTSVGVDDRPYSQLERLDYYDAARQLERIGDTATDIAQTALRSRSDDVATALESVGDEVALATEAVVGAIMAEDPERMRELLRQYRAHVRDVDRTIRGVSDTESVTDGDTPGSAHLALVRQCIEYTRNLAAIAQHSNYATT